ncbi:glutamine amidotransferase subunit pdxT [Coprinopsis sp. MPI-PUGE-AT-0042]|nr:glutamine amidotransferase subunit pdxT [Coprinopsis sp. MPI-PUGE-AT-0042]
MAGDTQAVSIGILALQGAFAEHQTSLERLHLPKKILGGVHAISILFGRISGLLEPLRQFVREKPVWGTCAGAILLSEKVENTKRGGQEVLGGMSITIARNGWGCILYLSYHIFTSIQVVLELKPKPEDPPIEVMASVPPELLPPALQSSDHSDEPKLYVALRQGLHLLTTFHPELTTMIGSTNTF